MPKLIWKKPERVALINRWDSIVQAYGATVIKSHRGAADDSAVVRFGPLSPERACSRMFEVQTVCGPAECNIDCGPIFAHIYFQFSDAAHAWAHIMGPDAGPRHAGGDLNGYSGKWNIWTSPDNYTLNGRPCPVTSADMLIQHFIGRLCRVATIPRDEMLARISAADVTAPKYETEAA